MKIRKKKLLEVLASTIKHDLHVLSQHDEREDGEN